MSEVKITSVRFKNFKAFEQFSVSLQDFNVLVGPNNSGKSTILNAFRVVAAGLRRAYARRPETVPAPGGGQAQGYPVPTEDIPMSFENVHHDYDDTRSSTITLHFSNKNQLVLFFTGDHKCWMIPETDKGSVRSPSTFKRQFPVQVDFIPVLGPLEHNEPRVEEKTVLQNLPTHRASRNFRNYWRYFPENFGEFAFLLKRTWPGVEIQPPEDLSMDAVYMFAIEDRIARELYWAGFGFQVWCQLLTHIVRTKHKDLLVVDEPEIYLHPDLQRQLLAILREAGPDILLATHSTEIMAETDPNEILLIEKSRRTAQRLKNIDEVQSAVEVLGSSQNITLTQLARTRRVLFVEGDDFKILSRFARVLGLDRVANVSDFTVVATEGFSQWPKLQALQWGFEKALGYRLVLGAIFDRDYRCEEEIISILDELRKSLHFVHFHSRKELENYLLVPSVLDRAIRIKTREYARHRGLEVPDTRKSHEILLEVTESMRREVQAQYIDHRVRFFRPTGIHSTTLTSDAIKIFDAQWQTLDTRLEIVPGKEVFSRLNQILQNEYSTGMTPAAVIREFRAEEIPGDLARLLRKIASSFSQVVS
jgi:energy-coupling factor transporter ATP-binding protein EcfA2